jgi:hypothetical protein
VRSEERASEVWNVRETVSRVHSGDAVEVDPIKLSRRAENEAQGNSMELIVFTPNLVGPRDGDQREVTR